MFDSVYLNFTSTLPRSLLEELVSLVCKDQTYGKIVKVFDQYVNFISLEEQMFAFPMADSFYTMNQPHATDLQMDQFVDSIVLSLFSVLVNYGKLLVEIYILYIQKRRQ